MRVGIMGLGVVGKAVRAVFREAHDIVEYDPPQELLGDLRKTDVVFLCVPTPTDRGHFDVSVVERSLDHLKSRFFRGVAAIKSTTLPR